MNDPADRRVAPLDVDRELQTKARLRELNADFGWQVIDRMQARGRSWALSPDLMGGLDRGGYFETSDPDGRRCWNPA